MVKDRIVIGSIAGMVATLVKDVPNIILYKLGVVKYLYIHLAASTHLLKAEIYTPLGYVLGILGDVITGGLIGVGTIIFLSYYGTDYWWYKGLIIGNAVWLFGLGVTLNLGTIHLPTFEPVFRLTALIDHQIFGLVTAYIVYRWSKRTGFKRD